jgi:hypothetical protein
MSAITLPDGVRPNLIEPFLLDFGTVLTPFGGGPAQRINRLGMRMGARITIAPRRYAATGMALVSRLMQARAGRLLVRWPQPGFTPGSEGTPRVKVAVSGGTTLQIKGLPAGKALVEGQALSVVKDQRYMHFMAAPGTTNGSGDLVASVWPPMRRAFAVDDVIEIAAPMIEGHVQPGEELAWRIAVDKMIDVSFTVHETR